LQALEIIYEQGLVPEPAYIFKHAVIQDVAYQSLLLQRRKALHRAVGEAIEELYQDRLEEHYTELAHHFSLGEVWDKALAYCRQAGEKALARSAYREAVRYCEQALSTLTHLPETRERREQAIDLHLALRSALLPSGDLERILASLHEAEALATTLGDHRRLGQVFLFLTVHFYQRGAYHRAITSGQRALRQQRDTH
jgi:predicted ATPase